MVERIDVRIERDNVLPNMFYVTTEVVNYDYDLDKRIFTEKKEQLFIGKENLKNGLKEIVDAIDTGCIELE